MWTSRRSLKGPANREGVVGEIRATDILVTKGGRLKAEDGDQTD